MARKKIVRVEVSPSLYESVSRTAEAKGVSLPEAFRIALQEWASREGDLSLDPLFDPTWKGTEGKKSDASKVDEVLYGRKRGRRTP